MSTKKNKDQKIVVTERVRRILNAISANAKMAAESHNKTTFSKHMDNLKQSIVILNQRLIEVKEKVKEEQRVIDLKEATDKIRREGDDSRTNKEV